MVTQDKKIIHSSWTRKCLFSSESFSREFVCFPQVLANQFKNFFFKIYPSFWKIRLFQWTLFFFKNEPFFFGVFVKNRQFFDNVWVFFWGGRSMLKRILMFQSYSVCFEMSSTMSLS